MKAVRSLTMRTLPRMTKVHDAPTVCQSGCMQPKVPHTMLRFRDRNTAPAFRGAGWAAALQEFEHQATHWDTPEHGETGHLIAEALRAAIAIARNGGLECEHRYKSCATSASSDSTSNGLAT
jgi:hypothetical protein